LPDATSAIQLTIRQYKISSILQSADEYCSNYYREQGSLAFEMARSLFIFLLLIVLSNQLRTSLALKEETVINISEMDNEGKALLSAVNL